MQKKASALRFWNGRRPREGGLSMVTVCKACAAVQTPSPISQPILPSKAHLKAFRTDHPDYNRNVFLMIPFTDIPEIVRTGKAVENALRRLRLICLRADDKTYGDSRQLWENITTYMEGCKYGVAVLVKLKMYPIQSPDRESSYEVIE